MRGTFSRKAQGSIFQDPCFQPLVDHPSDHAIRYSLVEERPKLRVRNRVEDRHAEAPEGGGGEGAEDGRAREADGGRASENFHQPGVEESVIEEAVEDEDIAVGNFSAEVIGRRTERFTGADLEDLVRRAGLFALRGAMDAKEVDMADFEHALEETRASVTEEVERDYEQMQGRLKQDALSAGGGIGFIAPGMLHPRGPKGSD